jgi:arylsulfatase A-like enzyme
MRAPINGGPILLAVALLLGLSGCGAQRGGDADSRPNVLLISIDTWRLDAAGFNGCRLADGSSPTPHLDALAARSAGLRDALSSCPLTLPAHVTVMSGLYPDGTGVRENDSFRVPPRGQRSYSLLAEDLADCGYHTAAFVSAQPLDRAFGLDAGFRVYDQPEDDPQRSAVLRFRERRCDETARRALAHLEDLGAPWLLFVHFFDPHQPYESDGRDVELAPGDPRRERPGYPTYLAEVMRVDAAVGQLLSALPGDGEDTLVIVFGDHGEALGEHGEPTHGYLVRDTTLRVPFLIKPPKGRHVAPPAVPARLVDVYPTVRAICGLEVSDTPRYGRDLAGEPSDDWIHRAETLYPYYQFRYARLRAVRDRTHKLIEGGGRVSLYAWRDDPGEMRDLAESLPGVVQGLQSRLSADLARLGTGVAQDLMPPVNSGHLYMGARRVGDVIEPGEAENRGLPRVEDRWQVVDDLDRARRLIHLRRPGAAELVLAAHRAEEATNPALLFWLARARHRSGLVEGLGSETSLEKLGSALELYDRHVALYHDPRSQDAGLRLLLDRFRVGGDRADLEELRARARTRALAGTATGLTYALRGRANEALGHRELALRDYAAAIQRDPEDLRFRLDHRRLSEEIGGPGGSPPRDR